MEMLYKHVELLRNSISVMLEEDYLSLKYDQRIYELTNSTPLGGRGFTVTPRCRAIQYYACSTEADQVVLYQPFPVVHSLLRWELYDTTHGYMAMHSRKSTVGIHAESPAKVRPSRALNLVTIVTPTWLLASGVRT